MRCPHCQKIFTGHPNFCPHCGRPIDWGQIQKQRQKASLASSIVLTVVFMVAGFFVLANSESSDGTGTVIAGLFFFVAGIAGFSLLLRLAGRGLRWFFVKVLKMDRVMSKRPVRITIGLAVPILLIALCYWGSVWYSYASIGGSRDKIQAVLSEVAALKTIGDSIQSGSKFIPADSSMVKINETVATRVEWLKSLSGSIRLPAYKSAVVIWATAIRDAAVNTADWKIITAQPPDFKLSLSSAQASDLLGDSIRRIAELKQAGDYAVRDNNREAMRYVAADLLIQKHWLDGIGYSSDPGFYALGGPRLAVAYDGAPRKVCNLDYRGRGVCYEEVATYTTEMYRAADDFVDGVDEAEQDWAGLNDLEGYYMLGCYGCIIQGEPDKLPEYPPVVQTFFDDCHARGGTVNGTGTSVKTRLPTTESGYTCAYDHNGNSCWDFLTYSHRYYAGGNPGCPEANLLPRAWFPAVTNANSGGGTITACDFNGKYSVAGTLRITSNYAPLNLSQNHTDTLTVANDALLDGNGKTHPIDDDGDVKISTTVATASGNGSAYVTYHFYCSGGRALVSGTFSGSTNASSGGVSLIMNFSGTTSGSKI